MQPILALGFIIDCPTQPKTKSNHKRILNPNHSLFTLLSFYWLRTFLHILCSLCSSLILKHSTMASNIATSYSKMRSTKASTLYSSIEPILKDTTQLFSLDPNNYDYYVRVIIEFISCHPIAVPWTKVPNPNFPPHFPHEAFEQIKIKKWHSWMHAQWGQDRFCD